MVHCVSDTCREQLDQKWNFCPFCGTDNRPPEYRPKIKNCRHEYVSATGYCVDCGHKYGADYGASLAVWQVRGGILLMALGALLIVAAFLIGQIHSQGHGPGYEWIRSWFDQPYLTRGKYGTTYTTYLGREVLTWMFLGSAFLILIGAGMLKPDLFARRRVDPWN
jgi:hypothetical protein